ncbi:conserved hypothetical protein [Streptomyces pristinaespiralis ATCC 25486]|uniref:Uncharacterized protein n=1 Tax=Streptomyces pristinaespiralis (strain ATCC 25486 / DSM 40338 / CBS 914.69 / JCM 4507 / KCC S-0507 / NBRC 13074 / NRRL 2958 / 5647) TaxID=457429 RepID=B5HHJ5_STRE2|nr:conserved hypothetical protein [Streptomyces pristinaespiralis ATCC 25486]
MSGLAARFPPFVRSAVRPTAVSRPRTVASPVRPADTGGPTAWPTEYLPEHLPDRVSDRPSTEYLTD